MTRGHRHAARPRRPLRRALPVALAFALAAVPAVQLPALELDYEVGAYLRHSDNLNLSETAPASDSVFAPTLSFDVAETGSRLKLSANGLVEYTDYLDDTYSDEVRGGFTGGLEWAIVPSRLNFVVQDYLSQQTISDTDPATPGNLQHVNLFVAGPSLFARFGPATLGQFDLRYGNTYAEETQEFQGDRFNAAARVQHQLSPASQLTFNLEAARVRYDRPGELANYDREDAFVNYKLRRELTDFDVDLGYTRLDRTAADERRTSPLARASISRRLTNRSRLRLSGAYRITDTTQYLIEPTLDFGRQRFGDLRYNNTRIDPNVFRERSARLSYEFDGASTDVRAQGYDLRNDYFQQSAEDHHYRGAAVDVEYRVRPHVSLNVLGAHQRIDFEQTARQDRESTFEVGLARRANRHWTGRVSVRHRQRDSTEPGQDFKENSVLLSVTYRR